MSHKTFTENLANASEFKKKKAGTLEISRNLGEIMSFFSALAYKNHTDPGFVDSIFSSLQMIIEANPLHLLACDLEHFVNSVLLAL